MNIISDHKQLPQGYLVAVDVDVVVFVVVVVSTGQLHFGIFDNSFI